MKKLYSLLSACSFTLMANFAGAQTVTVPFTSSGTFTVPTGVTTITIEVVGAGGEGGYNGGGGGGGGGYSLGTFSVAPGTTLPVTVGIGGSGSASGTTNVSTLIMATGGANGTTGGSISGGAGGTGLGGSVNRTGGAGGNGTYTYFGGGGGGAAGITSNGGVGGNTIPWTGICLTPGGASGTSGGAPGGAGGKGAGFTDVSCTATDPATDGSTYGAGGGGGNGVGSIAGEGANGYCIISYCSLDLTTTLAGVTITANATSPTSYQWINCTTGTAIAGETGATYTATTNGSYAVIIVDGDCTDTSACVAITSVGVNSVSKNELSIHPNPFKDKINVLNATGTEYYELHNASGQLIWYGKQISNQDFTFLQPDVYVLSILTGQDKSTYTLIKKE